MLVGGAVLALITMIAIPLYLRASGIYDLAWQRMNKEDAQKAVDQAAFVTNILIGIYWLALLLAFAGAVLFAVYKIRGRREGRHPK